MLCKGNYALHKFHFKFSHKKSTNMNCTYKHIVSSVADSDITISIARSSASKTAGLQETLPLPSIHLSDLQPRRSGITGQSGRRTDLYL